MNLMIGGNIFQNVQVPILWGKRAVLRDQQGRLSIVDLSGSEARLEIVGDEPAEDVRFSPRVDGFVMLDKDGHELYSYNPRDKTLSSISLDLSDCQITSSGTRIGGAFFSGNMMVGSGVGIIVTPTGIGMGARLPDGLARLVIKANTQS